MLSDTTAPAKELQDKLAALEQLLLAYGRVAIGFSGGVDSSFLAAVCARIMPASTLLVHLTTPLIGTPEQTSFERSVDRQTNEGPHFKLPVLNLSVDQLQLPQVACNDANRCYHCKRALFGQLLTLAEAEGLSTVMEGTHAGDSTEWRPGRRALAELGIVSPLAEAGLTKPEIRALAAAWALSVAQKPSAPCLATRFPYGTAITAEGLERVGIAEALLRRMLPGVRELRVRDHLPIARLEVPLESLQTVLDCRESVLERLRSVGYTFVTLDLAGFRSGSFDGALV